MRPTRARTVAFLVAFAVVGGLAAGVGTARAGAKGGTPVVPQDLLDAAGRDGDTVFDVLVEGDGSERSGKLADRLAEVLGKGSDRRALSEQLGAQFSTVAAVELRLSGKDLTRLAKVRDAGVVSVVPNASVAPEGWTWDNPQKWDETVRASWYWGWPQAAGSTPPTIAIVDSGVDNSSDQFGSRLLAQFDLGGGSAEGDPRGHGTFVAAMAAGAGTYAGVAPTANLVSLDVFDAQGRGRTSDVIRAADWILAHKDEYNIRVANFSLQSGQQSSFLYDPLDQAVERLWQAGIVVTAAAGNYAVDGNASGVLYAPANDPFVITVGAADIQGSANTSDDLNAPWSAYGYTNDGFAKPELGAPGRYLIEQVPSGSTLYRDFPNNVVGRDTIQLSGTSFAAPVVAGMAAAVLGAHPDWTPDQVKGVLMLSAQHVKQAASSSLGVGEVDLQKALQYNGTPPNPNLALDSFLVAGVFEAASWIAAAQGNASWNSASWNSASWNSASWNSASWNSASWNSASWNSASWNSASWNSASWNSVANNGASDGRASNY
jgi:serine protease AprX